jgi:hypothetical protein
VVVDLAEALAEEGQRRTGAFALRADYPVFVTGDEGRLR